MCDYVHRVVETGWYALVCHNIWHHKYIPVYLKEEESLDTQIFMLLTVPSFSEGLCMCLHLGNYRWR